MKERTLGFEDVIRQPVDDSASENDVLSYHVDDGDSQFIREKLTELIESNEGLACVVGLNGYHGPVILELLKEAGRLGDIKVVAFDEADATLDEIEAGHIYATIAQDPYNFGYESVRMLTSLHNGTADELPIVGGARTTVRC